MLYEVGDMIIYGGEGVCRVERIGIPDIPVANKERLYYTLKPVYRDGKTYTPVDTKIFSRLVISRQQANELIGKIDKIKPRACNENNFRTRSEHYEGFFQSYDCAELVRLIRTVNEKKADAEKNNKKLGQTEERYRKKAIEMLYGELAIALDIPIGEVEEYIEERNPIV